MSVRFSPRCYLTILDSSTLSEHAQFACAAGKFVSPVVRAYIRLEVLIRDSERFPTTKSRCPAALDTRLGSAWHDSTSICQLRSKSFVTAAGSRQLAVLPGEAASETSIRARSIPNWIMLSIDQIGWEFQLSDGIRPRRKDGVSLRSDAPLNGAARRDAVRPIRSTEESMTFRN